MAALALPAGGSLCFADSTQDGFGGRALITQQPDAHTQTNVYLSHFTADGDAGALRLTPAGLGGYASPA